MRRIFIFAAILLTFGIAAVGTRAQEPTPFVLPTPIPGDTVFGTISRDARFDRYERAAEASGLADDLSVRSRTYTVFAPRNSAWNPLLNQLGISFNQLLNDRALVRRIVQYHIVGGEFSLGDTIVQGAPLSVFTYSNDALTIDFNGQQILLNGGESVVIEPNLFASNGVVHTVNNLLLPPGISAQFPTPIPGSAASGAGVPAPTPYPAGSITQIASVSPGLTILTAALQASGFDETLASPGNFTVFAPTDGAFQTLLANLNETPQNLLLDLNLLNTVLPFHVSPQVYTAADLQTLGFNTLGAQVNGARLGGGRSDLFTIPTVNGTPLPLSIEGSRVILNNGQAAVLSTDIQATNGIIHTIDNVLVP